ncbi:pilus assembly protein [Oxalobacteraceae sp. CFBP 8763]|nr:pilus assembly protein [Oxalobacteraceae sp. CFBP 8763]
MRHLSFAVIGQARRQRGVAAVELALLLPMLVVLLLCAIDGARALQANIIITNISREGANILSRSGADLDDSSQDTINALMASAPPLNVNQLGMMYITRVMGDVTNGVSRSVVLDQYRWDDAERSQGFRRSGYSPQSKVYRCSAWSGTGKCSSVNSASRPVTTIMTGKLDPGEVIFVVETFYRFDMLVSGFTTGNNTLPTFGPDLYSMSVF